MALINFYAATRAATGVSQRVVAGKTLGEVIENTISEFPQLAELIPRCSYLINETASIKLSTEILDSDVIDILPQFAGGS